MRIAALALARQRVMAESVIGYSFLQIFFNTFTSDSLDILSSFGYAIIFFTYSIAA
jgi:hypothetical protein